MHMVVESMPRAVAVTQAVTMPIMFTQQTMCTPIIHTRTMTTIIHMATTGMLQAFTVWFLRNGF